MTLKPKSWLWKLTWPFAHNNYTVVFGTLYCPKGVKPSQRLIDHEEIHCRQAKEIGGWIPYYLLYLFCFPFLFNPWRKRWETEAYRDGSKWDERAIKQKLKTAMYGWLV
jgi:hypothetical protein